MKQKLFTLLTLLVLCVTGAWAQTTYTYTGYSTQIANGWTHDYGNTYVGRKGSNYTPNTNGLPTGNSKIFAVFQVSNTSKIKVTFVWTKTNGDLSGKSIALASINKDTFDKLALASTATTNDVKYSISDFTSSQSVDVAINRSDANTDKDFEFANAVDAGYYAVYTASSINENALIKKITLTPSTTYAITWNNGGHGTAPTTPTTASSFALPTMDADGDYVNVGWTANQTVKVGGNDVAAGTEIAVGTSVTLTAATTFTGVWKTASSFALTSASEVEVAIDGTSMITTSGNAGDVDYESGDLSVATVDGSGEITAVGSGKTTITVTDPGNASTMGKSYTVTVLVPYPNPTAADAYTLDNSQYAFSNSDNTKYYFKNGFAITNTASKAYGSANMGDAGTGMKFSANTAYTINVPSNVTVTYAVFTARNNYGSDKAAANWGTVFGTDYSATALPWSNETPADKDFVLDPAQTGGTLAFTPGGNQWQAIITLNTIAYHEKYAVSYAAGEGTGTMAGTEVRGGSKFNLPASTFTAPAEKGFAGWLCDIDNVVYDAGAEYTMTDAATTFTAQYAGVEGKMIIKAAPKSTSAATVTGAIGGTADVNLQNGGDDGWKFGGDTHHIGITLASGWTFKTGDVINVHITKEQDTGGEIIFYNSDQSVIYDTNDAGVLGDNKYVLTDAFEGKTAIYLYRLNETNKWNAYIDFVEVTRPNTTITLNASGYATYSAASDFTVAGAKAYKAALNTTDNKITCTEVEAIPAGDGVLLFGDAGAKVAIVNTTSAAALADNDLKGTTLADGTLAAFDNAKYYYALSGDTFKHYTGTAFVAGKAYFESNTELNAKAFAIVFDGETTGINGIEEVAPATTKTRKVVKNGRLVIETANGEYTVSGARIK